MQKNLVVTLNGMDRVGIVEHVTGLVLKYHGNVLESKSARLGGEFAMLMLVQVDEENIQELSDMLSALDKDHFSIVIKATDDSSFKFSGWMPYQVEVKGADHEGIIHHIAGYMAEQGINIETMDTFRVIAPMSGIPLFTMNAVILVPPSIPSAQWRDQLQEVGLNMNVDVTVSAYKA